MDREGLTPLHQQIRSQLSSVNTTIHIRQTQLQSLQALLAQESERIKHINESEAILAELTRDYNVTQDFYNDMLKRLENARVSVQLNEQEQGVTFKVQEAAVLPTSPDGLPFRFLLLGSFLSALIAPIAVLAMVMELDKRIRSSTGWRDTWPELLITVPHIAYRRKAVIGHRVFCVVVAAFALASYAGAIAFHAIVRV